MYMKVLQRNSFSHLCIILKVQQLLKKSLKNSKHLNAFPFLGAPGASSVLWDLDCGPNLPLHSLLVLDKVFSFLGDCLSLLQQDLISFCLSVLGTFPSCLYKGIISITIYGISGWRNVKISMLRPFGAAYGL